MGFMNLLRHFLGNDWGVHPDDHKRPAADAAAARPAGAGAALPAAAAACRQPARPIVLVGQKVQKGELIAEAQGMVSAPIHAPTSGTIAAMTKLPRRIRPG